MVYSGNRNNNNNHFNSYEVQEKKKKKMLNIFGNWWKLISLEMNVISTWTDLQREFNVLNSSENKRNLS